MLEVGDKLGVGDMVNEEVGSTSTNTLDVRVLVRIFSTVSSSVIVVTISLFLNKTGISEVTGAISCVL